ncbi:MAG: HD domain-containing protein, partial [Candidatus Helarchaeales archaeon]
MNNSLFTPKKAIYDNVHGYIDLYQPEIMIINSELFQRLRGILQLGMGNLVYPGATHTRFAHSLGVLYVITEMMYALGINKPKIQDIHKYIENVEKEEKFNPQTILPEDDRYYYFTIRMAALLHDIGHLPFSHVFELFFDKIIPAKSDYKPHEYFSKQLIDFPTINNVLSDAKYKEFNYNVEIIKGMIVGDLSLCPTRFAQLLHSIFDADRIDYLLRDSVNTGLVFGHIDIERIYKNIKIIPFNENDHIIAINNK